jgi:hypothetical protein
MKRTLPLLLALLVLLAGGAVYGLWTQRWGRSDALAEAAGRLEHLPDTLLGWQVEPVEMDTQAMLQAGAVSWWARRFTLPRSGESVTVVLMCGRPGRMSVHLPQQCYRGEGYSVETAPVQRTLPDGDQQAQLWTARFSRQEASGTITLRIDWSWFGNGAWQAPTAPRWTFAPLPALYKPPRCTSST